MTHGSPRAWNERDHPRDGEGRFRDRVGSGGWAQRISDAIGRGRGGSQIEPGTQRRAGMRGVERHPDRDAYNAHVIGRAGQSLMVEDAMNASSRGDHARLDSIIDRLAAGDTRLDRPGSFDDWLAGRSEIGDSQHWNIGNVQGRPLPGGFPDRGEADADPQSEDAIQALRESALDALDPHGPTRRAAIDIFKELELDPAHIGEWYRIASPAPSREVNWDDLDQIMAMNIQDMTEPSDYREFATKLMERYPGRFPSSLEMTSDYLATVGEPPLAPVDISIADLRARIPHSADFTGDDSGDFAEPLQALQFWDAHYGAWRQSSNHHFDSEGRLVLMGDGEDAWDEKTTVTGGVTMAPATLSRSAGYETVEPGWQPNPEREYYDDEGGYWISGAHVPVRNEATETFDEDEYDMEDGNEGDAFVGLSSVFFGEQVQWRPLVPKPEGA